MTTLRALPALFVAANTLLATTLTGCGQAPVAAPVASASPAGHAVAFGNHTLEAVRPVTEAESRQLAAFAQTYGFGDADAVATGYALQAAPLPKASAAPALEAQIRKEMTTFGMLVFESKDKNRDGRLTSQELPPTSSEFRLLDRNRDGVLTRAEMQRYGDLTPASEIAKQVERNLAYADQVLRAIDKNKDKKLSKAEYQAGWKAGFQKVIDEAAGGVVYDAPTQAKFFRTYAGKDGQLSREGVAQVLEDAQFTVGLMIVMMVLGMSN
jgi:Ca2+-binding EF-hand superfamily protein